MPAVDQAILDLIATADLGEHADLVCEMVSTSVRFGLDGNDRGQLKLINTALRDLRRAANSFRPYQARRKASIFGSARIIAGTPAYEAAERMGAALAANDWMVITGGGPGIMTAGIEGAGRDNAFGVTIRLPFEPMDAGGIVPDERLVRFRHFFTRKLTFMRESSAYVVFPGGFGTLDETFELLTLIQTGKEPPSPVVLFEPEDTGYWKLWREFVNVELLKPGLVSPVDLDLVHITASVDDAMEYIDGFYKVFHSMRYVDGRLVIRLETPVSDATLERLNIEFSDILVDGAIERTTALEPEIDDDDEVWRPRLLLSFDNRHFSRLHQLVRSL
ncbi:MAG: LOG family protein [Acidimicrobiales bacterium]